MVEEEDWRENIYCQQRYYLVKGRSEERHKKKSLRGEGGYGLYVLSRILATGSYYM